MQANSQRMTFDSYACSVLLVQASYSDQEPACSCSTSNFESMIDQKKTSSPATAENFSEAERMAKIRELLVGPAIADESARVDETVARLNDLVRDQQETIVTLQARIRDLEDDQRVDMASLRVRLLGIVETLLAEEEEVRSRLMRSETLMSKLEPYPEDKSA